MPNYQSDYEGFIKDDGCLCFDLVRIAEMKTGQELTHLQLADLIHVLHWKVNCLYDKNRPVLSDEDEIDKPGIFVWDHEVVINQALFFMNIYNLKIEYIGRKYTPEQEAMGRVSFGTHANADEVIFQVQTDNGGHFIYPPLYDPYEPGVHIIRFKSARYYQWIKE